MFQPAISAGVADRPMPKGLCACARVAHASATTTNAAMHSSRVGIGHLAVSCDAPGPDRIVVVIMIVAANREKFGQRRLDVTGFIDGAALDHGGLTVPVPGKPEAGQRPCQYRFLQLRFLPALAVIDRNIDTPDLAVPAPGDAADLVKSARA